MSAPIESSHEPPTVDEAATQPCVAESPAATFTTGVALAIAGTFLFALKSIFIKLAFAAGATATEVLAVRMALAFPFYVVVLILLRRRASGKTPRAISRLQVATAMLLGFLGYYLASYLDLRGLEYISAQLERLTLFTYPTMVALLAAVFLGERLTPRIVVAIALSYAGVWLMYSQERLITTSDHVTTGVLLVLGSALSYSAYVLLAKPMMQKVGSRLFTSLAMIGSTMFVAIHFVATHAPSDLARLPPIVYLYGVFLALVCTVLPSYMINESIVRIGATRATVIGTVGPVLTMLLAIVVLKEPTSLVHAAGMLIAVLGVSLVAVK